MAGRRVKLAPQPFQVLALIVRARGELVTREEVRTAVWADGTTVEFDQGLNYCLRQIRIALHDNARNPTYIETVPKRGYRLLVPVVTSSVAPSSAPPEDRPETPAPLPGRSPARQRTFWTAVAILAVVAVAALAARWPPRTAPPPVSEARNPDVDRLLLEADHLAGSWELAKVTDAVARYQAAIRLEPRSADAWAGLTNAEILLSLVGPDPARALRDSEAHARRALELDGSLSAAHAALGHNYWHEWRWREAEHELQLAVDRDDRNAVAHQLLGMFLASAGRREEAIVHARRAVELAPVSGLFNYSLSRVYLQTGDFGAAIAQAQRTLEMERHFPLAYATLIRAHIQLGHFTEASQVIELAQRYSPAGGPEPWRAYLLARMGRRSEARTVLSAFRAASRRPRWPVSTAAVLLTLGDRDAALGVLEAASDAHVSGLIWLGTAPELTPLRQDPRFVRVMSRISGH